MMRFIIVALQLAVVLTVATVSGNVTENTPVISDKLLDSSSIFSRHLKIIGGENASSEEFPWFGQTRITVNSTGQSLSYVCGGSLIHSDIVVSAAHCAVNYIRDNPRDTTSITIQFYLGANLYNGSDGIIYEVSDIYWPRTYASLSEDDIVFYKLSNSSSVPPVPWNTDPSIPVVGDIGTAIGFGRTSNDGRLSPTLLKADLTVISNAECRDAYTVFDGIDREIVCTFGQGRSTCNGDSGGPILTQDGYIFGVTSFASINGCDTGPTGFTRVSRYSDMIASVSTSKSCLLCSRAMHTTKYIVDSFIFWWSAVSTNVTAVGCLLLCVDVFFLTIQHDTAYIGITTSLSGHL